MDRGDIGKSREFLEDVGVARDLADSRTAGSERAVVHGLAGLIENAPPSGMPVYEGVLTDDEIIAVLSFIKSTWPDDLRQYHDELNAQSE